MKTLGALNFDDFELAGQGSLRLIELNAPEKLNALSRENWVNLKTLVEEASGKNATLVITSARYNREAGGKHKPPVFCSGFDLEELYEASKIPADFALSIQALHEAYFAILKHPRPVFVVADGLAYGGGCGLALCGDFIAATPESLFSFPTDPRLKAVAHIIEPFVARRLTPFAPPAADSMLFSMAGVASPLPQRWDGRGIPVGTALGKGLIDMVLERRPTEEEFCEFAKGLLSDPAFATFEAAKNRRPFSEEAAQKTREEVEKPEVFEPAAKFLEERHLERLAKRAGAKADSGEAGPKAA